MTITPFFIVWIAIGLAAWGVLLLGLLSRVTSRDQILLGGGFLLPSIVVGFAAYALFLLAFVAGGDAIDADLFLPEWVFVVIAIGLIMGLFVIIGIATQLLPWVLATHSLEATDHTLRLRRRLPPAELGTIHLDEPYTLEHKRTYSLTTQSDTISNDALHYDIYIFTQNDQEVRVQLEGGFHAERQGDAHNPLQAPRRVHFAPDQKRLKDQVERWRKNAQMYTTNWER